MKTNKGKKYRTTGTRTDKNIDKQAARSIAQEIDIFSHDSKTQKPQNLQLEGKPLIFAIEYLKDRNGMRAARTAGYPEEQAKSISQYYLKHPAVSQFIRMHELRLMKEADIQITDVINSLIQIATSNIEDYLNSDGTVKDLQDCPNTAAVAELSTLETIAKDGTRRIQTKVRLHNKINALENLGKYLGIYERDNRQRPAPQTINLDSLNIQQLQAIVTATPEQLQKALSQNQGTGDTQTVYTEAEEQ
jgi:phage terminase small subunit